MSPDYWLLDLDGTVLSVEEEYIHETLAAVGSELGREFTPEENISIWYGRDGLRNDILTSYGIQPSSFWSAFHEIESPSERAAATYLHPDAETLTELSGPRGVVTHCQSHLVTPIFDRLDMHDWFDTVVTCSDAVGWKPDPAPVELAMEELAVDAESGALVGDSLADIQAANAVGLTSIYIDRTGTGDPPAADFVIESFDELL